MRPTWTLLEDLPDPAPKPCTVEQDQEDFLIEKIGLSKFGELCQMEDENAQDKTDRIHFLETARVV
jgi:hypothetical protein